LLGLALLLTPAAASASLVAPTITPPANPDYVVGNDIPFELGPGGATDVVAYEWSLIGRGPVRVPGSQVTVVVPLRRSGPETLTVVSLDADGNRSPQAQLTFLVRSPVRETNRWKLDDGSGSSAANSVADSRALRLSAGTSWGPGRQSDTLPDDHGVIFDGVKGFATTGARTVETTKSFSVAGFVTIADTSRRQVIFSQDWLSVEYDGAGAAVFAVRKANGDLVTVKETVFVGAGEWIHLAAVYSSLDGGSITLYVDAETSGPTAIGAGLAPSCGSFRVGASRSGGYWQGAVDDIRLFDGALEENQVLQLLDRSPGI
jgi:hypothetical protein